MNLYTNALKFTGRNGKITILVEILTTENFDSNDQIRISVIDNGLGIKRKNQSKMFQLFSSFKDEARGINTKGIGLGLVISKQIVEKFNGMIDFLSKYKQGTTFFFTLDILAFEQEEIFAQNAQRADKLEEPVQVIERVS